MENQNDVNIRFSIDHETHKKVLRLQGLFTYKEGRKPGIQEMYIRLVERGLLELQKTNKV